jgi:hypothetical protein
VVGDVGKVIPERKELEDELRRVDLLRRNARTAAMAEVLEDFDEVRVR